MPRWLSSKKLEVVKQLLADDVRAFATPFLQKLPLSRRNAVQLSCPFRSPQCCTRFLFHFRLTFPIRRSHFARACAARSLRESMGVGADSTQKAFQSADIVAFLTRARARIPNRPPTVRAGAEHVIVAVDPSGGGSSAFAVASVLQLTSGGLVVRARSRDSRNSRNSRNFFEPALRATSPQGPHTA